MRGLPRPGLQIHVAKGGNEKPFALEQPVDRSVRDECHTKEHSDTFQYEAYLRDSPARATPRSCTTKLGDGPTGHQLRTAALDKAGRSLGKGCTR